MCEHLWVCWLGAREPVIWAASLSLFLSLSLSLSLSPSAARHLRTGVLLHIVKLWTVQNSACRRAGSHHWIRIAGLPSAGHAGECVLHRSKEVGRRGDLTLHNLKSSLLRLVSGPRNLPVNQPNTLFIKSDACIIWISQGFFTLFTEILKIISNKVISSTKQTPRNRLCFYTCVSVHLLSFFLNV